MRSGPDKHSDDRAGMIDTIRPVGNDMAPGSHRPGLTADVPTALPPEPHWIGRSDVAVKIGRPTRAVGTPSDFRAWARSGQGSMPGNSGSTTASYQSFSLGSAISYSVLQFLLVLFEYSTTVNRTSNRRGEVVRRSTSLRRHDDQLAASSRSSVKSRIAASASIGSPKAKPWAYSQPS
jgi:hypothetical protein